MPDETMASAVARTVASLTLQANLFQLFHPIGGVSAMPFGASPARGGPAGAGAWAAAGGQSRKAARPAARLERRTCVTPSSKYQVSANLAAPRPDRKASR